MRYFLSLLVLFNCAPQMPAGCSGGNCSPVGGFDFYQYPTMNYGPTYYTPTYTQPVVQPTVQATTPAKYEWKQLPIEGNPNVKQYYCHKDGVVVGTYQNGKYYPMIGYRQFGAACQPPVAMPTETLEVMKQFEAATTTMVDGKPVTNFGLDLGKIQEKGDSTIPDDVNKWRVTVRSDDKNVVKQAQDATAPWKDKILFQAYPPNHWALEPGLNFGTVHIQKPPRDDGKAVLVSTIRDADNVGPATTTALRKADPTFDPAKVPDTSKGFSFDEVLKWLKSASPVGVPYWVLVAGAAFLYLRSKNKAK